MFEIINLEVTPFSQNARILIAGDKKSAVVIDPGGEPERILKALTSRGATCKEIWLTHAHLDHCGGVAPLIEATGAELLAHAGESQLRSNVEYVCQMYGVPPGLMVNCPEPDRTIDGGDVLELGDDRFEVLFTPGHSPGHVCFYHRESGTLIAGDTVFAGSIGRTDLPGGDHRLLLKSIQSAILSLPDETVIMPGHGPDTTVGEERRTNPFLKGGLW